MIYLRGDIYHAKFKRDKRTINRSLKTSDRLIALEREAALKASYDMLGASSMISSQQPPINTKSVDELMPLAANMLSGMKSRARKKGLPCNATKGDLLLLLTSCRGLCAVTGVPLDMDTKIEGKRVSPWMPSIDRIDSNKGYVSGNIRIVCYTANLAMSQFGESALELMLHYYAQSKFKKRSAV